MQREILVTSDDALERIDSYLVKQLDVSRSFIISLIKKEDILVNNKSTKPSYKVKAEDTIQVINLEKEQINIKAEEMDLDIVYEDDDLLVINKESGTVVHPAPGSPNQTLVNGLLFHSKSLSANNGEYRPGVVHRIDKNTSGLLVFAKNDKAHDFISKQLQDKTVTRKYIALVHGVIPQDRLIIDAPIGRDINDRKKMSVTTKNSKDAITNVEVLKRFKDYTLISCVLETGRTHQIRVHLKYIEYPIVGDPEYGPRKTLNCKGQALHAKTLGFIHPTKNEYVEFTSELPQYFEELINGLES